MGTVTSIADVRHPRTARTNTRGAWLPTRADLDAATARTAAAIADPAASLADVERAAELEETAFAAYLQRPEAEAELEAGI